MSPEITNLLITGSLGIVLLVIFIWLLRALMPSTEERARQAARDDYDIAGYESMDQIRRKEYAVMGIGVFVIVLCVAIIGGLGYLLWQSGMSTTPGDIDGMDTLLIFIPAVVMLVMIIRTSKSYMEHQRGVLREFKVFRAKRDKAIKEYEAKRSGSDKKKDEKKPGRRTRSAPRKPKRRGPPKLR